jgi:hypothetical protein
VAKWPRHIYARAHLCRLWTPLLGRAYRRVSGPASRTTFPANGRGLALIPAAERTLLRGVHESVYRLIMIKLCWR